MDEGLDDPIDSAPGPKSGTMVALAGTETIYKGGFPRFKGCLLGVRDIKVANEWLDVAALDSHIYTCTYLSHRSPPPIPVIGTPIR
jgi:hypothetical protein